MSHVPETAHSDPYPHGSYSSAEHPHRWRLLALLCLASSPPDPLRASVRH